MSATLETRTAAGENRIIPAAGVRPAERAEPADLIARRRRGIALGLLVSAQFVVMLDAAEYFVTVLPGLLLVAVGVALSFTPTTMVIASGVPASHAGLASGLAGSATQIGAALGTATFTAIGISVGASGTGMLSTTGFSAAFTAAAVVAVATAVLGSTVARARR